MTNTIIVGVEGSGGAKQALRWAINEAKLRDAKIEVVTAYTSTFVSTASDVNYTPVETINLQEQIQEMQKEVVDSVLDSLDSKSDIPEIECKLIKGRPANALISAAESVDMLVVGSRGRGGFKGLLLGSVSHQIVQHSKCPVVIVPSTDD